MSRVDEVRELAFSRVLEKEAAAETEIAQDPRQRLLAGESLFWRELAGREPTALDLLHRERGQRGQLAELRLLIRRYLREYAAEARRPADIQQLELVRSSYDEEELLAAVDVLLEDRLTMGPRVAAFEDAWAQYLDTSFSVMVNSGSSANLLALSALAFPGKEQHLCPGDEVIIPAVAWSTSLFPIAQVGCVPVLVDIDLATLNVDPARVKEAITPKTRAIMAVHLLGNPCDMASLREIAVKHDLWLIEDCCEAHGASIDGRKVGTFGDLSTFSFYFSHHMTAIEGGTVCGAENGEWRDLLVSMRAHGWTRGRSDSDEWASRHPDIDPRWLFVTTGYNLRPTEINAAFAQVQLSKLPGFIEQRMATRGRLLERLKEFAPHLLAQKELNGHTHTAFGLSLLVSERAPFTRAEFQAYLESCRIQTRPIVGSNLARQPAMRHVAHRVHGELTNSDRAHFHGLMIANHHNVTRSQEEYLIDCIQSFFVKHHATTALRS